VSAAGQRKRCDVSSEEHGKAHDTLVRAVDREARQKGWVGAQLPYPARHATYRIGDVIVLANCNGEVGRVRVYPSGRMRVVKEQP
jgi:hypothetical protein